MVVTGIEEGDFIAVAQVILVQRYLRQCTVDTVHPTTAFAMLQFGKGNAVGIRHSADIGAAALIAISRLTQGRLQRIPCRPVLTTAAGKGVCA